MSRIFLVALGCLHLLGGEYGVMQGFAWASMLVTYSSEKGLAQGISDTFDGEHPCKMCVAIEESKLQDSDEEPLLPRTDQFSLRELLPMSQVRLVDVAAHASGGQSPGEREYFLAGRDECPPVPPPQLLA